jgi:hypothetical protein
LWCVPIIQLLSSRNRLLSLNRLSSLHCIGLIEAVMEVQYRRPHRWRVPRIALLMPIARCCRASESIRCCVLEWRFVALVLHHRCSLMRRIDLSMPIAILTLLRIGVVVRCACSDSSIAAANHARLALSSSSSYACSDRSSLACSDIGAFCSSLVVVFNVFVDNDCIVGCSCCCCWQQVNTLAIDGAPDWLAIRALY